MPTTTPVRKRRHRLLKALAIATVLLLAILFAAPQLLSTPPARRLVLTFANEMLAPGRVEMDSLRLSWTGPTRMTGLVLKDPRGKRVLVAPLATLDRNLRQLLLDRPRYGTLTLDRATLDIERRDDGSIDLVDALGTILASDPDEESDPRTDITLAIARGTLRVKSPELIEPLAAERLDLTLRVPAAPGRMSWEGRLANPSRSGGETLEIGGHYDHRAKAGTPPALALTATGGRWPWAVAEAGVIARGRFDGKVEAVQQEGHWKLSGDAQVLGLDVAGAALAGDQLRLDRVGGAWDLGQADGAWSVRRLELTSPVASIHAKGALPAVPGSATRIEGQIDLAALARQLPRTLRLRDGLTLERGAAKVGADLRAEPGGQRLDIEARLSDLVARDAVKAITLRDPATLTAHLTRRGADLRVEGLAVKTAFLDASGSGDLDRGINLTGTLDLGGLQGQLRDLVAFGGLGLKGQARLAADYRRTGPAFAGHLTVEFRDLQVDGLASEPIREGTLHLAAGVDGPVADSGLPTGWSSARLGLKGGAREADVTATSSDGSLSLAATASGPLKLSGRDGRAQVRFAGRWTDPALEIDEIRIGLRPADPKLGAGAIDLTARGRFDSASGDLLLTPPTGEKRGTLALISKGLHVSGLGQSGATMQVEGGLAGDLAAMDRALSAWTGGPPNGLAGALFAQVVARRDKDGRLLVSARIDAPDLSLAEADGQSRRTEGPLSITSRATYRADADRIDFADLSLTSRYGAIQAKGSLVEPGGRRLADLQGTLAPDWALVNTLVDAWVEPQARVDGRARPFRVRGALSGASTAAILAGLDAEVGVELTRADAFGMKVGPAPIVARCAGGRLTIDPIVTTVNGGRVDLRPEVVLADPRGMALRLASGSAIEGAEINEEVSRRVLSYVVPVLHEATQVRGRVSVSISRAEFPIGGADDRKTAVDGQVVFQDVVFGPGPFAGQLLALVGKGEAPALRLHQPVQLSIADGRVIQKGLTIPVDRDVQVVLDGSVGFDRTLALNAGVPITASMLGRQAVVNEIVGGTRVAVPIAGTLSQPRIDRRALQVALRDAGRSMIRRGAEVGAGELLRRLDPSAAPNGSPRPSPDLRGSVRGLGEEALRGLLPRRPDTPGAGDR